MSEFFRDGGVDLLFAILGIAVALWSLVAATWQLRRSWQREAIAFSALAVAFALLYRERRTDGLTHLTAEK